MLAALGRLAHRRRRLIITAWSALLVLGFTVGVSVFNHLSDSGGVTASESARGMELLKSGQRHSAGVVAVVSGARVDAPRTRNAVQAVTAKLEALPYVHEVHNAYNSPDADLTSSDGRTSIVAVVTERTTDMMAVQMRVDELRDLLHGSVPGATVQVGGDLAVMRDEMATSQTDLVRGEAIALPILLLALLFVFRGWRAALLPLAGALVTVAGALLLLLAVTKFIDVASYAVDVIALFGLALAVDYSLLMVSRFREERADGTDVPDRRRTHRDDRRAHHHLLRADRHRLPGRPVRVRRPHLHLARRRRHRHRPGRAGRRAHPGPRADRHWGHASPPAAHRRHGPPRNGGRPTDGFFGRLARAVGRRPVLVAVAVTGRAARRRRCRSSASTTATATRALPASHESRQATDTLLAAFPALRADPSRSSPTPAQRPAGRRLRRPAMQPAARRHRRHRRRRPARHGSPRSTSIPAGQPQGADAQQLVHDLRADRPGFPTYVTGQAAFLIDFKQQITSRLPYALGLIAAATFVLLFLMTGSVLVPIKALVMNILSLGATFGALVWIFQDGHLSGLLGFTAFGAIEVWVPVVVFVFALRPVDGLRGVPAVADQGAATTGPATPTAPSPPGCSAPAGSSPPPPSWS